MEFHFKKGVYKLNEQKNQLNRVVMWGGGDLEEIKAAGPKIKDERGLEKRADRPGRQGGIGGQDGKCHCLLPDERILYV